MQCFTALSSWKYQACFTSGHIRITDGHGLVCSAAPVTRPNSDVSKDFQGVLSCSLNWRQTICYWGIFSNIFGVNKILLIVAGKLKCFFPLRICIACVVTWATCLKPLGVWKRLRYVTAGCHLYRCVVCIFVVDFYLLFSLSLVHTSLFLVPPTKAIDVFPFSSDIFKQIRVLSLQHPCPSEEQEIVAFFRVAVSFSPLT